MEAGSVASFEYRLDDMITGIQDIHWTERSEAVRSCILFQRASRGSRIFSNMADILTEVMHLYSTGRLTCSWRTRDNE